MRLISSVLALSLITSAAFAADPGLLPTGSPGGVKKAQMGENTVPYLLVGAGVITAIVLAATRDGGSAPAPGPTTTTSTSTTG